MKASFGAVLTAFLIVAVAGEGFADRGGLTYLKKKESVKYGHAALQDCTATEDAEKHPVFKKNGERVSVPGTVSVRLEDWEAVYIPIDVETNWFKSTRRTSKPVLVQMTVTPSTYLPFSDNAEFIKLMEDTDKRRDFIFGLEKAVGREVAEIEKVKHEGRAYIGTRFKSESDEKVLFTLGSIAKNGLMVAFTFCFDRDDEAAVTDLSGASIISAFLENVSFGPRFNFEF